ncbi:hypothetical protein ACWEWG_40060 [Streptomyces sp. NPDC003758]
MSTAVLRRPKRWFWALTAIAVCAAGALYDGLRAAPRPGTGLRVLISSLVLAASAVQAARIVAVLTGRPRPSTAVFAPRVFAPNGGRENHRGWYHNLTGQPRRLR